MWLLDGNPWAKANLRAGGRGAGHCAERLVFAPSCLGRAPGAQRGAPICSSTRCPYNADTTASDALWAGLPGADLRGRDFRRSGGGQPVRAIGLGELVTTSLEEYEALALRLAHEPKVHAQRFARLARTG